MIAMIGRLCCRFGNHRWLNWRHTGLANVRECARCGRREQLSFVIGEWEHDYWFKDPYQAAQEKRAGRKGGA